jgi:hypothetical protein
MTDTDMLHMAALEKRCEELEAATSRDTPLKVIIEGDGYDDKVEIDYDTAYCPVCNHVYEVDYDTHDNYCRNCGQKLDWSDVDENS